MRSPEIEALCAAIVPGDGPVHIQPLSRGLVNETYRVRRQGLEYSLRLAVADGRSIALDRAWEARLLQIAGDADVAPALSFADAERGILLCEWQPGSSWRRPAGSDQQDIEPIARLLQRVHALSVPRPPHRMNPASWLKHYESCGPGALARWPAASRHLSEWAGLPGVSEVVCHGDVHALNLVQSGDSIRLLDWEYAHVSEPFWDLAGWCANEDLETAARHRLLTCYLGHVPTAQEWRRLELLLWLYDYVCMQWSVLCLNRDPDGPAAAGVARRRVLLDARLSIPAN